MVEGVVNNPYNLNYEHGEADKKEVIFDPYDLNRKVEVPKKQKLSPLSQGNHGIWDPYDLSRRIG